MTHSTLEYYSAHDYHKLNDEFHQYKQQSIAKLEQCKAALCKILVKAVIWNESHGYEFEEGKFYILYNSHTDQVFFSVGPPWRENTHFLVSDNMPRP